jgi:hypothetical protein
VVIGKKVETEEIPAYSAVAMAGLDWLPDTIMTRSVVVRMKRRRPDQSVEAYRPRLHEAEGRELRDRLVEWSKSVVTAWPDLPDDIQDRDADIWEPLVAIADAVGGAWPALARKAAVTLVALSKDREPSLGVKLLADIRTVFIGRDLLSGKDLVAELLALEESPWGDLYGRELDQRGLAKRLRAYEIKPQVHRQGMGTVRGYRRSDFVEAWGSYLPPSPAEAKQAKHAKQPQETGAKGPTLANIVTLVPDVSRVPEDDPADWSAARLEMEMPDIPEALRR